jgi:hypothetical protein
MLRQGEDRQGHSIDGDRPLLDDVAGATAAGTSIRTISECSDGCTIHMPLHEGPSRRRSDPRRAAALTALRSQAW